VAENLGEARLRLSADGRKLEGALKGAQRQVKRLGIAIAAVGALAVTGSLAAGVKIFTEYEQSMAKVKAVSGATEEEFRKLDEIAREMGRTTVFTARQSAEALSFMAMAGLDANESIAALPDVLNLAAAGQLELGTAADIVTNVMAGYGIAAEDLTKAVDVMTVGFTSANTDLQQLGEAFKFAGPVANAAGIDFEETAAALSLLGNAGFQSSLAGTALRGAITRLLNPTDEARAILERLGVTVVDSEGKMLPLVEIIRQFEGAGLTAADAMAIFGQRAGPGMLALIEQGSGALEQLTLEMQNSGGTAESIAQTQLDTFQGKITLLKSALEGMAITLGEAVVPILQRLVEWITPVVQRFSDMLAGTGETGEMFSKLAEIWETTVLPILKGLWDFISNEIVPLFRDYFLPAVRALWEFFVQKIIPMFLELVEYVWPLIVEAWHEHLKPTFEALASFIQDILWPIFQTVWEAIDGIVLRVMKSIWSAVETTLGVVLGTVRTILALLRGDWSGAWQAIKDVVEEITENILALIRIWEIDDAFRTVWNSIVDIVKGAVNNIIGAINTFIGWINTLVGAWNDLEFRLPVITIPGFSIPAVKLPDFLGGFGFPGISWGGTSFGGQTFSTPNLPTINPLPTLGAAGGPVTSESGRILQLAEGGIVTSPILAEIGERGPEAVVPLDRMPMGNTFYLMVDGNIFGNEEFADYLVDQLQTRARQGLIEGIA